jgi:hypothetical protein
MTNDTVPTLTTTNHLHIPTLFMHQSRVQTPNLDLSMATWPISSCWCPTHTDTAQQAAWTIWQPCARQIFRDQKNKIKCKPPAMLQLLFMNWHLHFIEQVVEAIRMPSVTISRPGTHCHYSVAEWEQPTALMEQSRQTQRKMQRN